MPDLFIQPISLATVATLLLDLVGLVYVLSIRKKSTATRWLAVVLAGLALFAGFSSAGNALYVPTTRIASVMGFMMVASGCIFLWGYLHFAYRFLHNPFPKESRIVFWASSLVLGLYLGVVGYLTLIRAIPLFNRPADVVLFQVLMGCLIVGATAVFLRKWRHAKRTASDPQAPRAHRAYALVNVLGITSLVLGTLSMAGVVDASEGTWLDVLGNGSQIAWLFGMVVVYLNYAPEPTSFQVKLIGLSLAAVLSLVMLVPKVIYTNLTVKDARPPVPQRESRRYTPDGEGGYVVTARPYRLYMDLGTSLGLERVADGDTTVALAFDFPFYGVAHREIVIDDDPVITLAGHFTNIGAAYQSTAPMIVPLLVGLQPSVAGGVYLRQDSSRAVITWYEAALESGFWGRLVSGKVTLQVVLHDDGVIDFVYGDIDADRAYFRGLAPGGGLFERRSTWNERTGGLSPVLPAGSAFIERLADTDRPAREAMRFVPDGAGGYEAMALDYRLDDPKGEDLALSDDEARPVALDFGFPFGDRRWDSLYVSPNGAVSFGRTLYGASPVHNEHFIFKDLPLIAPLSVDLDPSGGGGVFLRRETDRVAITWDEVPQFGTNRRNTFQLVLHRDGAIDIVYEHVEADLEAAYRAVVPGGVPAYARRAALDGLPYRIAPGESYMEDATRVYRMRQHEALIPVVWLIVGATLFVLVVSPFSFRSTLVKPLARLRRGVQQVNAGDLETEVPVQVRDEIGHLTHHFNGMTQSLRRYRDEMESLVAERTAALNRSLQDLKATQAQLVQQEKMASLGTLTAGIAHEIKNPLNFVNNFSELTGELVEELNAEIDANPDKSVAEVARDIEEILADLKVNAEQIRKHGKRADSIVQAMMQHVSGGSGRREATDVNALVSEYMDLAYHGKRAQLPDFTCEIEKDLGADVGQVAIVPQEIGRVLLNLLGNAFDAGDERRAMREKEIAGRADSDGHGDGTSAAWGTRTDTASRVRVSTRRDGDTVEIRVSDNGVGIPAELRERIFEPFFTTKPTGSGTGLGLSLSYDIVTQGHQGTLTVESEEGEGATFIVTLPVNHRVPAA